MNDCNALLECASSDPKKRVGGCPISRALKGNVALSVDAALES